mgnify:CR=1 FL=1
MSGTQTAFLVFGGLMLLLALRVPIGVAMFVAGAAGYLLLTDGSIATFLVNLNYLPFARLSNYDLAVIPLFLLMGQFATHGGLSRLLFGFVRAFLGHRRGGMAMAAVGACAGFGAICGSSLATAATMGQVALPELRRYGYSGSLATGALAAGGTLGIMIPPSVPLIIYAVLTQESIGKLFMAALSRADNPRGDFPPFYLYIDEFQNFVTNTFADILSEARKYRLSLIMAHQYIAQLDGGGGDV